MLGQNGMGWCMVRLIACRWCAGVSANFAPSPASIVTNQQDVLTLRAEVCGVACACYLRGDVPPGCSCIDNRVSYSHFVPCMQLWMRQIHVTPLKHIHKYHYQCQWSTDNPGPGHADVTIGLPLRRGCENRDSSYSIPLRRGAWIIQYMKYGSRITV